MTTYVLQSQKRLVLSVIMLGLTACMPATAANYGHLLMLFQKNAQNRGNPSGITTANSVKKSARFSPRTLARMAKKQVQNRAAAPVRQVIMPAPVEPVQNMITVEADTHVPEVIKQTDRPVEVAPAPVIAPVQPIAEAKKIEKITVPQVEECNIQQVADDLEQYINNVELCIHRLLDPKVSGKKQAFIQEIDTYVFDLEKQVISKLKDHIHTDPVCARLYSFAQVLKNNQCQFKNKLSEKYTQAIALGWALDGLGNQATKAIHRELNNIRSTMYASPVASTFKTIEQKILKLSDNKPNIFDALSALRKRI